MENINFNINRVVNNNHTLGFKQIFTEWKNMGFDCGRNRRVFFGIAEHYSSQIDY